MSSVISHISVSLDGFVAGPNPSRDEPLGEGGEGLHEWAIALESWRRPHGLPGGETGPDADILDRITADVGAVIMGRRMFGGGEGPWDLDWKGWWGDEPPFRTPVFVLTHHPRERLEMRGTSFTFVTEGIESALEQARAAAGAGKVLVAGGAQAIQQYLAAGLLEELHLHVVPIILGGGARLLENVGRPRLEPVEIIGSPRVTHLSYRVDR